MASKESIKTSSNLLDVSASGHRSGHRLSFVPSNVRPIQAESITAHIHMHSLNSLISLAFPNEFADFTRAHNPLVRGSSPLLDQHC
jgi:hypothetical protein